MVKDSANTCLCSNTASLDVNVDRAEITLQKRQLNPDGHVKRALVSVGGAPCSTAAKGIKIAHKAGTNQVVGGLGSQGGTSTTELDLLYTNLAFSSIHKLGHSLGNAHE